MYKFCAPMWCSLVQGGDAGGDDDGGMAQDVVTQSAECVPAAPWVVPTPAQMGR